VRIVRPEDLVVLDVELVNLIPDGQILRRADPNEPGLVLFTLPPQHVKEGLYDPTQDRPTDAAVSGPTRLAFTLDQHADGIPLTAIALLDWQNLVPNSVPHPGIPHDPGDPTSFLGTPRMAIEFPARLLLTHLFDSTWTHRTEPFTAGQRTELWHTRLVSTQGQSEISLRAYSRREGRPPGPGLDDQTLGDIVTLVNTEETPVLTAGEFLDLIPILQARGFPEAAERARQLSQIGWPWGMYQGEPLFAELFMFTALGASARIRGQWHFPEEPLPLLEVMGWPTPSVEHYHHVTALGRDQYVRVVKRGYLSSGHRAAITVISERQFVSDNDGLPVAGLIQQRFITVQEPEVRYGDGYAHEGREMPFVSLRVTNLVTPPLGDFPPGGAFWIQIDGTDHLFEMIGTDADGRQVTFTMPAVFVPYQGTAAGVFDEGPDERRIRPMHHQTLALAPGDGSGSTAFPVASLTFGLTGASHPTGLLPMVKEAAVQVPAVEQLTGRAADTVVSYAQGYLEQGLGHHPSGVFLTMADTALEMGAERAGGLAKPNTVVNAISSRGGVLPDLFAAEVVDVQAMALAFGGAKLLGVFDLRDILADPGRLTDSAFPPKLDDALRDRLLRDADSLLPAPLLRTTDLSDGVELRYLWKPKLRSAGPLRLDGASLLLDAQVVRGKDGAVRSAVLGNMKRFAFELGDLVTVRFEELAFVSRPGQKPDVKATGVEMEFGGALEFVSQLRRLLPKDCFGDGSIVEVTPSGIVAGYKVAVPTASVGVFTLRNLTLSAVLTIPFDERPARLRFALSERHSPFGLTVGIFGGGGFFALEVTTRGLELLEGALEFGGSAALDLGVASGGVSVMGGVYFRLAGDGAVTVQGYLRCGGYLSVLGLISVSVEFYLALEYHKDASGNTMLRGQGSVTVSVRVVLFSKSVSLKLERSFGGSPGDPTFEDCVEPADWDEYCLAFAGGV
jgi:hypothetical protein